MDRMAWNAARTYRIADGRGVRRMAMHFAPSILRWATGNTQVTSLALAEFKQKYGRIAQLGDSR